MTARCAPALVLAAGLLAATGCGAGKLDVTQTAEPSPGNPKIYDIDAASGAQTVTVEYDSDPAPVEIGIFKAADADEAELLRPDKALKYEKGNQKGKISAEVPSGSGAKVVVGSLKGKTSVKLHMTN